MSDSHAAINMDYVFSIFRKLREELPQLVAPTYKDHADVAMLNYAEQIEAELHEAQEGELKNALAVGQACIELREERNENERLRADLTEARRLLADLNKVVIDLMLAAAPVPAQPSALPEAVESLIPKGWVFYSADASIQSSNPRRPMAAMIKRDVDGVQWWLQLTEEEKEVTPLHSSGAGMTLSQAIQNAVAAILSATDDEVKNG